MWKSRLIWWCASSILHSFACSPYSAASPTHSGRIEVTEVGLKECGRLRRRICGIPGATNNDVNTRTDAPVETSQIRSALAVWDRA